MGKTYQPRFVAYCIAQGRAPEQQLEHDAVRWPGGKMAGFLIWGSQMKREYAAELPGRLRSDGMIKNHDEYTDWLMQRAGAAKRTEAA